jgi:cytochrome c-type biogenesis protein CcmH
MRRAMPRQDCHRSAVSLPRPRALRRAGRPVTGLRRGIAVPAAFPAGAAETAPCRAPAPPQPGLGLPRRARPRRILVGLSALLLALWAGSALAVEPDEMLRDPTLEARARTLSQELRCLVCQNQSIDDSNAALAKDLRLLVRERLQAGDSDAAVLAFVEARYGEFVLLRPKLNAHTLLLWLAPLILLVASALLLLRRARRGAAGADNEAAPLTSAEHERLEALIGRKLPKP